MLRAHIVFALLSALTTSAGAQVQPSGMQHGAEPPQCAAVVAGLRKLDASARATLTEVQSQRREAERLADWFGAEPFEAFIAALRHQERALRTALDQIAATQCGATRPPLE